MKSMTPTAGLVLLAAASACAQPVLYYVPGTPTDLSADGSIAVGSAGNDQFRWRRDAATPYQLLGSGSAGIANISGDGSIISGDMDNIFNVNGLGTDRSMAGRWTELDGWLDMGLFEGGTRCDFTITFNYGLSNDGRFSVGGGWWGGCRTRAFIYDANTQIMSILTPLPAYPAFPGPDTDHKDHRGASQRANAVSDDGSVVCGFDHHPVNGVRRPAVWRNNVERVLDDAGELFSVTADGSSVYGWSSTLGSDHLVRWDWDGANWIANDLGTAPGGGSLAPVATTPDGSITVGVIGTGAGGFINFDEGPVQNFADYVATQNVPGSEPIVFDRVTALSHNGRTFAGHMVADYPQAFSFMNMGFVLALDGGPCIAPSLTQPLPNLNRNPNLNARMIAFHEGAAPFTYQWFRNGQPMTDGITSWGSLVYGTTTPTLFIDFVQPQDTARYQVQITNGCGDILTDVGTLTVTGSCPADFSGSSDPNDPGYGVADLSVDAADFFFFLDMFVAGNAGVADLSGATDPNDPAYGVPDGNVDASDFFYFLDLFVQGCP